MNNKINSSLKKCSSKICLIVFLLLLGSLTFASNQPEKNENHKNNIIEKMNEFDFDPIINLLGILVGAGLIVWQMGRQHKSSLHLQKENFRDELKLKIYNKLGECSNEASQKNISAGTKARTFPISLEVFAMEIKQGLRPPPVSAREHEFRNAHAESMQSISKLMGVLEEFEIADPIFRIFKTALNSAHHNLSAAFDPLWREFLKILPYDVRKEDLEKVGSTVLVPKIPTEEDIQKVRHLGETYCEASMDLGSYLYDLQIEAQNTLLGGLFENRVPPRKPLDPRHIVISTSSSSSIEELEKYFYEKTEWGKKYQELQKK